MSGMTRGKLLMAALGYFLRRLFHLRRDPRPCPVCGRKPELEHCPDGRVAYRCNDGGRAYHYVAGRATQVLAAELLHMDLPRHAWNFEVDQQARDRSRRLRGLLQ